MKRLCGAKTRVSGRCSKPAMPDSARCRWHGARAGRPRGTPMHENTRVALRTGRARWVERMRQAKAAGLIKRFPNGRRPKDAPKRSSDKRVRKAQVIIESVMAEKVTLPAKPWSEMSRGEKLATAADRALTVTKEFLDREIDPDDQKMVAAQVQTALAVIGYQLKAETAR